MQFSRSWLELGALALVIGACGGGSRAQAQRDDRPPVPDAATAPAQQDLSLPPAGYGSLRQDQVGVNLATSNLRIRVIPLDERVIRLLAPDAYRSLHDVRESRSADILTAARASGRGDSAMVFMVTFFGLQPQTRFNPDDLLIVSQNATFRPIGRVALTPRFNENELNPREQLAAIYLYEPGIAIGRPFIVQYGPVVSEAWAQTVNLLNAERTRVLARAAARPTQP